MSETLRDYQDKITTAEVAVDIIRSGDHVFVGTACATPCLLVRTLEASQRRLKDVQLIHFIADDVYPQTEDGELTTRFQHKIFFVGMDDREIIKQGKANYIPIPISQLPRLIESGRIPIDVALIQTTPPDGHGYVSLGVSVDITRAAVMNARKVIAEINPNMPWTHGNSFISVDKIDHMVEVDTPVKTFPHPPVDEVAEMMARYVASIIDDGSTLQIGLGRVPNGMLKYLKNRRNLGIHSDVICEEIIDLIEEGIITGDAKTHYRGQIVTSYCMGVTRRLYDFIDHNPMFSFHPIEFVCDPANISRNRKMVSVSQAWAIDLNGQVCTDQLNGELYSGVSTQPDFIRGAANSAGGKPIICLASTTDDGKESRIRPRLREGEGVTIPRSDVHYVVTEYGIAYIYAKSLGERALRLIQIAHPDFRPELLEDAKRLGYVRKDQVLESKVSYPVNEERTVTLKNGETVLLRPSMASDVEGLQDLFYHLPPEDIETRFFQRLSSLPVSKAEMFCNVDYENEMAFLAMSGELEAETVVGNGLYCIDDATHLAEFAYMIHPQWQGKGLGGLLKQRMIEYAKSKGVRGYVEIFLEDNEKMKRLAQRGTNVKITYEHGRGEAITLF